MLYKSTVFSYIKEYAAMPQTDATGQSKITKTIYQSSLNAHAKRKAPSMEDAIEEAIEEDGGDLKQSAKKSKRAPMTDVAIQELYKHQPIEYVENRIICKCNQLTLSGKSKFMIERHFQQKGHLDYLANKKRTRRAAVSDSSIQQNYHHQPLALTVDQKIICQCNQFMLSGKSKYDIERHFKQKRHMDFVARRQEEEGGASLLENQLDV